MQPSTDLYDEELENILVLVSIIEGNTGHSKTNKDIDYMEESYTHDCQIDSESEQLRGKFISDNVYNLSKRTFSEAEIKLLSRGLGFVPTPEKIDRWQVKQDLEKFGRNLRLKIYYLDQPTPYFSETPAFRAPSNWIPIVGYVELEMYLSEIEEEILKINKEEIIQICQKKNDKR